MAIGFVGLFCALLTAQDRPDPNRPPCKTADCRKARLYVKAHYCGDPNAGNGPDDGCEPKVPTKPQKGIDVLASYDCAWSEKLGSMQCSQHGQPPAEIKSLLMRELHRAGLPTDASGATFFTVWKSESTGWSTAVAYYSHPSGSDLELCEVVVSVDDRASATVLRKLAFQKIDSDVPAVTQWTLVDLAGITGAGHDDVVLEADAYENHWFEVVRVANGGAQTIFSGLGYYL
jgi:hypothetical protein